MRFDARPLARLYARSVPPAEDYDRSIAVGIVSVPACGADEGRLVLAASSVRGSTGAAGLRRISWVNFYQFSSLISEHGLYLMPSDIEDGAIETAFLCDVASGRVDGTDSACGHVLSTKSFHDHNSVATADVRSSNMRPMLANASLPSAEFGNAAISLGVAFRPPLAATGDALRLADAPTDNINRERQCVSRTVRKHQWDSHTTVDTDHAGNFLSVIGHLAANADLPSECSTSDSGFSDIATQRSCVAKFNPTNLRQLHTRPATIDLLNAYRAPNERESVVYALPFELRIAAETLPRSAKRFVQSLKNALLRLLRNGANKVHLGAELRQLTCLRHVIEIVSGLGLEIAPMVQTLVQCEVPHQSTNARKLVEQNDLFGSRA